jgi:hypothetical protein
MNYAALNYAALFQATLPETALEIAALLVLVVDLAFLRKAMRVPGSRDWRGRCGSTGWNSCADRADTSFADRFEFHPQPR